MIRFRRQLLKPQYKTYTSEGHKLPMNFRIAVQTNDMRLYYRLLNLFKKSKLKVNFFTPKQPINHNKYDLIVTTKRINNSPSDIPILNITSRQVNPNLILQILGIIARKQEPKFKQVILGIDPGEWIGIAVICDGMLLATKTSNSGLDQLTLIIQDYLITFPSEKVVIRVGDQPTQTSNILFNKLFSIFGDRENVVFEVVQEAFSSSKRDLLSYTPNIDESAAIVIAKRSGKIKDQLLSEEISVGRIKEIQKWSRKKTQNRITLDKNLAKLVALGHISLEQAIIQKQKELETRKELEANKNE